MSGDHLPEHEIRKKALAGFKWAALGKGVATAYSFAITLLMVRLLAPTDYGLQVMWEAPVEFAVLLGVFCLDQSLIRNRIQDRATLAQVFGLLIVANTLAAALLIGAAPAIARYYKIEQLETILRVLSIPIILMPLRVIPNALLDIQMKFHLKAKIEIASITIAATLGLMLANFGWGVWSLVATMLIDSSLRIILMAWVQPWFIQPSFGITHLRPTLQYASALMLGAMAVFAGSKANGIVAAPILGADEMGLYAVAMSLALLPIVKLMPILNQVLFPTYANLKEASDRKNYHLRVVNVCAMIVFPVSIGMALTASLFVPAFFGEKWQDMANILSLLAALIPIGLVCQLSATAMNAGGAATHVTRISIYSTATNLLLIVPATIYGGLHGLVMIVYLLRGIELVLTLFSLKRTLNITAREIIKSIQAALFSTIAMTIAVASTMVLFSNHSTQWIELLLCVSIGAVSYALTLRIAFYSEIKSIVTLMRMKT